MSDSYVTGRAALTRSSAVRTEERPRTATRMARFRFAREQRFARVHTRKDEWAAGPNRE